MPKKRRRNDGDTLHLSLSVNSSNAPGYSDMEGCLAELEQLCGLDQVVLPPVPQSEAYSPNKKKNKTSPATNLSENELNKDDNKLKLWDPTITKPRFPKESLERIESWNTALNLWITRGTYTPGLLPSFETEVARHFQVEKLSKYLLETCKGLKMPTFERWLLDSKMEERSRDNTADLDNHATSDAILSNRVQHYFQASQRLIEEMVEAKLSHKEATKVVKELCRRTHAAVAEVSAQSRRYAHKIPLQKGDRIELEKHDQIYSLLYNSKKYKKPFCIRLAKTHYYKLQQMFWHVHGQATTRIIRSSSTSGATKALHAFHYIIMTVLLRYSSLSGGQLLLEMRGGGMQGAIHGQVFQELRESFPSGPLLECFASPLNAYVPTFCSAFPDIDWHFGSVGDFMSHLITSGCCEANPPFTPGLMSAMVQRIEYCLAEADRKKTALTITVIVPTVQDTLTDAACAKRFAATPFRRMVASPSCRMHIVLSAREHGYIAGAQHLKTKRYKYSIFETSVIVLQSQASRQQAVSDGFEQRIRDAFRSLHLIEAAESKTKGDAKISRDDVAK